MYQNRARKRTRLLRNETFMLLFRKMFNLLALSTQNFVKNTKNKVPKSDIEYISMISPDFDGRWGRFRGIFAHLSKNPYYKQTRKSENLTDPPSKSVEIIEIDSISDFGTLFFVFFTKFRVDKASRNHNFPNKHMKVSFLNNRVRFRAR